MRDRSTLIDLALAFAATFVITLALWPKATPRQVVRCNTAEAGWKTYSIAIDDPSLDDLRQQVHRWNTPEADSNYASAKWQKEVAEFYEQCKPCEPADDQNTGSEPSDKDGPATATISDTVLRVSFEMPVATHRNPVQTAVYLESPSPSDTNYWASVKASAAASMKAVEDRSLNAPVIFEHVTPAGWPQLAFHFAFLFGVAAACGYMHWLKIAPIQRGTAFSDQPLRALARIGTFTGLICLAMLSSIAVWI